MNNPQEQNIPQRVKLFTKEEVTQIVAKFAKTYNTEKIFEGESVSLDDAVEKVKYLIEWDI